MIKMTISSGSGSNIVILDPTSELGPYFSLNLTSEGFLLLSLREGGLNRLKDGNNNSRSNFLGKFFAR